MRVHSWVFAAAAGAALSFASLAFAGDISGTAKLDGAAPEAKPIDMSGVQQCADMHPDPVYEQDIVANDKSMLANVVVSVKKEDSPDLTGEAPKEAAVIDQTGCMYNPHVLAMMTGQEFKVKNSDNFLHNIHTLSEKNPSFNKAQPSKNDGEKVDSPTVPEYFHVKCDVHPWMSMYVAVFDHPFFGVSDADGKWTIKNLPDGDYTLTAWQEKLGTQEQKITVKDGKPTADIVFTFKPEAAMGPDAHEVILASSSGDKDKASCPACCAPPSRAAAVAGK
jgi:plastocyanin